MVTAAIYARISLDRKDRAGVDRQLEDCRKLAAEKGWNVVEYVDNDISAFQKKRRPEWQRLLADVRSGAVKAIVAYHPDRLYRRLADLEEFIEVVSAAKAQVVTVKAGDIDLATASGKMIAAILGSVAKHESERTGERVARAKRQRAIQGKASGGGRRPFGLSDDRTKLNPKEAAEIRRIADAVRTGVTTWTAEVDRLNAKGILTSSGNQWTVGSLRRALTSPYVAGLRSYHGEVIGAAEWPAILDRDVWDDLRAAVATRQRGRRPADRHLLTGLLVCGRCGFRLYATERNQRTIRNYACSVVATTKGKGCGGVSISAGPLEEHVEAKVLGWLTNTTLMRQVAAAVSGTTVDIAEQVDELDRARRWLAKRWADGEITDAAFDLEKAELARRQAELETSRLHRPQRPTLDVVNLASLWPALTVPEKRAALAAIVVTPVVVAPAVKGGKLEDRVDVQPATTTP